MNYNNTHVLLPCNIYLFFEDQTEYDKTWRLSTEFFILFGFGLINQSLDFSITTDGIETDL